MRHDQLSKSLIETFFPELLLLVVPDSAPLLHAREAWAFAALMRPGRRSRAQLKMDCLRRISRSEVSGLRKEMLVNWVESYVKLRPQEAAEFQWLLEQEENREVETMALTWLGKAEARGKAQGIEIATEQVRKEALSQLERQFGTVPEGARRKLESMRSIKRLTRLIARTPTARSIDDLGLN